MPKLTMLDQVVMASALMRLFEGVNDATSATGGCDKDRKLVTGTSDDKARVGFYEGAPEVNVNRMTGAGAYVLGGKSVVSNGPTFRDV